MKGSQSPNPVLTYYWWMLLLISDSCPGSHGHSLDVSVNGASRRYTLSGIVTVIESPDGDGIPYYLTRLPVRNRREVPPEKNEQVYLFRAGSRSARSKGEFFFRNLVRAFKAKG